MGNQQTGNFGGDLNMEKSMYMMMIEKSKTYNLSLIHIFLKEKGESGVSLSVQRTNGAVRMYQRLGFQIIDENKEEYLMMNELSRRC